MPEDSWHSNPPSKCGEDGRLQESTIDERRTLLPGKYGGKKGSGGERGTYIVERPDAKTLWIFCRQEMIWLRV